MRRLVLLMSISSTAAAVLMLACGSGGSGGVGGGGLTTSAPPDKQVSALPANDATQYCVDVANYMNPALANLRHKTDCLREATKALQGATTEAELRSKCSSAYQACLGRPAAASKPALDPGSCKDRNSANCAVTVAELNRCVEDTVARARSAESVMDSFCQNIQTDGGGVSTSSLDSSDPPSCAVVADKCSSFAD